MPRERLPIGELGSINHTKLESGGWLAYAYYRDAYGKRRKLSATGPTKPKATTALKAKATQLHTTPESRTLTIKQAAEEWLDALPTTGIKPATARTYHQAAELHIIPLAGELTIHELTTSRVTDLLHRISTPRTHPELGTIGGPTPARHARVCLGLIYKRLIHDGHIEHSPVTYARSPKEPHKRVEHVLTIEEIRAIRRHIAVWGEVSSASGPKHNAQLLLDFVDVLAGTGMRPGEVLALRWADVDLTTGVLYVRSTLTRIKGQGLVAQPTPKSLYSQRGLVVPDFVAAVLNRRYLDGTGRVDEPVFATRNGTFISDSNMRRLWRSARAGRFEGVDFAAYRKAVATLIERAEGMEAAGKALGHSSPEITRRYYVQRESVVDYTAVLGEVLGENAP